jgi:hypothetical protein
MGARRSPRHALSVGYPGGGAHNRDRELVWAYGFDKDHARCATTSVKTPGCPGSGYERCGSNTFPTGSFTGCVSPLGVYDLHGNGAEHMNLPMHPSELGSVGGHGFTEMKGSWFIFASTEAHPDDCRWRAPDWHGSSVTSPRSHSNYHLGFVAVATCPPSTRRPRPDAPTPSAGRRRGRGVRVDDGDARPGLHRR